MRRQLLIFAVLAACSEHRPRPIESAPAPSPPEVPVGLDARPVSTTCRPPTGGSLIGLRKITTAKLEQPVEMALQGGHLYVLEQVGRVLRLNDDGATTSVVFDIRSKVASGGELGLLGIAFHPHFAANGFAFLYYTRSEPLQSLLVRVKSNDGGLTFDPASEKPILTVDQPYENHNGGTIAFGNDGLLYWGLGDGGSGGDPHGNGQNKKALLGKMLRIDVDHGEPYEIPPTNPFANGKGGLPEIYALGLRNPYRFRFDAVTGDLWAGDVGQGAREEIDKIVLGGNYGWNVREGKACYDAPTCDSTGLIDPIVDHPRTEATSITGGVVYRGTGVPLLTGKYVYGDFGQGTLFAIPIDGSAQGPRRLDEGLPRTNPSAFAIDKDGEVLVLDYGGALFKIVAGVAPGSMPEKLSATGCLEPQGLFPYDVNEPQWLDGTTSQRALSIPGDGVIKSDPEGRLLLPSGSIAIRTVSAEGRRRETQLLVKRDSGWSAHLYMWDTDQKDATLTPSTQCVTCHAEGAPIGLEAAQLDRDDVEYPGKRQGNPLGTLVKLGMLEGPISRDVYAPLAGQDGFPTAALRARSYLHANCAFCHKDALDLRYRTPFRDTHLCNVPGANGLRLVPRAPLESQLLRTMQSTDAGRMPPVGVSIPDADGIAIVSSWIESIGSCPL